jgi:hypothetical protein
MKTNSDPVIELSETEFLVIEFSEIEFLIEQLQIMEHGQDTARIAKIAAKYGIPHFVTPS